jgi:hypothetical protein
LSGAKPKRLIWKERNWRSSKERKLPNKAIEAITVPKPAAGLGR